ncbi:MAG: glycosyl transferase [Bacteroidaceae bacterium]|nr:glycosyl transferase [Bacteroidaceae bacterium]
MKNTSIPKVIHYCWFGRNPLPQMAVMCIESWKKYLPGYEIKEWNEDNFDIRINPYVEEAYHMKKYAFVSDFARFWVLYKYGGIYFDIDVELLKPIDDILEKGPFMGLEGFEPWYKYRDLKAAPAAGLGMASYPGLDVIKDMMEYYYGKHFISLKGKLQYKTVVLIVADVLLDKGGVIDPENITLCSGIYIYPEEYFNPKRVATGKITITENTRSIHHYSSTWVDRKRVRGLKMHRERFMNLMLRLRLSIKRVFSK